MPGQRGVARRTFPRRRIRRTRIKSGYPVYVRRFKMLLFSKQGKGPFLVDPPSPAELEWELTVLDELEQRCHATLTALGVPTEMWEYYVGFAKRVWERDVHFGQGTFQLEKQSLIYEYTQRGLNPTVLAAVQVHGEDMGAIKAEPDLWWLVTPQLFFSEDWSFAPPPPWILLFSEDWQYGDPIGLELKFLEDWNYSEPSITTQIFVEAWSS